MTTVPESGTIKENSVNNLRVEMSQGSLIEQRPQHTAADVTDEYLRAATPQIGKITRDEGYNEKIHKNEIAFADWLHNCFGGEIKLLKEIKADKIQTPDFIWNGRLWDLKTASTEKSANSAIRKGLHQIEANPGGIFLDFGDKDISLDTLLEVIENRMLYHKDRSADIMIIQKGKVIKVLRYKKRETNPPPT